MSRDDNRYKLDEGCRRNELVAIYVKNEKGAHSIDQENATGWGITALQELQGPESTHELADDRARHYLDE